MLRMNGEKFSFSCQNHQLHNQGLLLGNREALFEKLDQMLMDSEREDALNALLLCDVDNFKTVNDQYGHKAADFCLTEISKKISKLISNWLNLKTLERNLKKWAPIPRVNVFGRSSTLIRRILRP